MATRSQIRVFVFYGSGNHRDLHSFPTRRSSDLGRARCRRRGSPHHPDQPRRKATVAGGYKLCRAGSQSAPRRPGASRRSEEHTSELQSRENLVCRLLLEKKKKRLKQIITVVELT